MILVIQRTNFTPMADVQTSANEAHSIIIQQIALAQKEKFLLTKRIVVSNYNGYDLHSFRNFFLHFELVLLLNL